MLQGFLHVHGLDSESPHQLIFSIWDDFDKLDWLEWYQDLC